MLNFKTWMREVETILEDSDESFNSMNYQYHQWWELWDHQVSPQDAANAAMILHPGENQPQTNHAAYLPKYNHYNHARRYYNTATKEGTK